MRRPLGIIGFSYLFSLGVALFLPLPAKLPAVLALLGCALLTVAIGGKQLRPTALICLTAAVGVLANYRATTDRMLPQQALAGSAGSFTVQVTDLPQYSGQTTGFTGRVIGCDLPQAPDEFLIYFTVLGSADVQQGQYIAVSTQLQRADEDQIFDSFLGRGIFLRAFVPSADQLVYPPVPDSDSGMATFWADARRQLADGVYRQLPAQAGGAVCAMSLGDKRYLSADTKEAYAAAGISHLLALSGLHVAVVAGLLTALLQLLGLGYRVNTLLCAAVCLAYGALVGFSPSVVRALCMFFYARSALLFYKSVDPYTLLGVAALVLTAGDPLAVADVRLLLSLGATAGLVLLLPRLQRRRSRGPVAASLCQTLAATLCTLPVAAVSVGKVSLLGLLSNLVCIPLCGIVVSLGLIGALLTALPGVGSVGFLPLVISGLAARGIELVAGQMYRFVQRFPWLLVDAGTPTALTVIGVALILLALMLWLPRRHRFDSDRGTGVK